MPLSTSPPEGALLLALADADFVLVTRADLELVIRAALVLVCLAPAGVETEKTEPPTGLYCQESAVVQMKRWLLKSHRIAYRDPRNSLY